MNDTRRPRSSASGDLRALLERMDDRQQAGQQEIHSAIQGLRDHLGRTDARVEGLAQDLQREVTHIDTRVGRMFESSQGDIQALRKALEEHESKAASDAAEGAAKGAVEGVTRAALPSPDEQAAALRKMLWARAGNVGVFGLLVILVLKEVPLLLRSIGGFFAWLANVK